MDKNLRVISEADRLLDAAAVRRRRNSEGNAKQNGVADNRVRGKTTMHKDLCGGSAAKKKFPEKAGDEPSVKFGVWLHF